MQRFIGKVAIVTGSGQGIGKGIAARLAREGAHVVIAEYSAETGAAAAAEIKAEGCEATAYRIDISDTDAVNGMVAELAERLGHIDILVNNAGVVQTKPMMELGPEDWDRVLDVNLRGTFFLIQAVARQMISQAPEALAGGCVRARRHLQREEAGSGRCRHRRVGRKLRQDRQPVVGGRTAGPAAADPLCGVTRPASSA